MRSTGLRLLLALPAAVLLFFLLAPVLLVIPISFSDAMGLQFPPPAYSLQRFALFANSPDWIASSLLSLRVSFGAAAIAIPLGSGIALGIVRGRFRGKSVITSLVMAPIVMPTVIYALAMFFFYRRIGLFDTELGLMLAYVVMCLPFVVVIAAARFRSFDESLEIAAMSLGATWFQALRHVTIPLTWSGIFAGGVIAFIYIVDEVVIALFITRSATTPLPIKMFTSLQDETDPLLAVVATLLIVFSLVLAGVAALLARRKPE